MSCCGEPRNQDAQQDIANRVSPFNPAVVSQQPVPSPQPSLNAQQNARTEVQTQRSLKTPPQAHTSTSRLSNSTSPTSTVFPYAVSDSRPVSSLGYPLSNLLELSNLRSTVIFPASSESSTSIRKSGKQSGPSPEGRLSVAIDFGTTFSGVAYGSSRIASGKVQQILNWPGSSETFRKIPTCLLYDDAGQVLAWGLEAHNANIGLIPNTVKCEWFKLFLEPHALRDPTTIDPRLPRLPPGKRAVDLVTDFLSCLWEHAKRQITKEIGAVADLDSADVWLTVPAAWDATGCQIMREAAIAAGLVRAVGEGDSAWKERLRIISEPEAAAVHCAHLTQLHKLMPSQNFMICDAGGGTVDLAIYKITGALAGLEIAEVCARSGGNCGSIFLDVRFRALVRRLLVDHPVHLSAESMANFEKNFRETDKLMYMGESDDATMFRFTCFNIEDPDDPAVGLINGDLVIPGIMLREEVFEPVVSQVLDLIEEQSRKIDQRLHAILLVGGFSGSEYLFRKVQEQFGSRISVIARPPDCDTATLRGAAKYGLAKRSIVSSIVVPQSYMMKVKLPAEPEDYLKRPAYIHPNDSGMPMCDNRLQYLVVKGGIMHKGKRLKYPFCKYSQGPQDRIFQVKLYTSDTDKIMRYRDEGEAQELCDWSVDLGLLPRFEQNAEAACGQGFYTEFELAIEVDSVEIKGILLCDGKDWGGMVFAYRT